MQSTQIMQTVAGLLVLGSATMKNFPSPIFRLLKHRSLPFIPLRTINLQIDAQDASPQHCHPLLRQTPTTHQPSVNSRNRSTAP